MTRAILLAAALAFAAGCGRDPFPIATVSDASAIPCVPSDPAAPCPTGMFCQAGICGGTVGECTLTHPPDCDVSAYRPECGCNGVSYYNGCLRMEASESAWSQTACEDQQLVGTNAPHAFCGPFFNGATCPSGQTCAAVLQPQRDFFASFLPDAGPESLQTAGNNLLTGACMIPLVSKSGNCWVVPSCDAPDDSPDPTFLLSCSGECKPACAAIRGGGPTLACDPGDASSD
jgi:hypothetical protein